MTNLVSILDGFNAALELERELGTRTVVCDRQLLVSAVATEKPKETAPLQVRRNINVETGVQAKMPAVQVRRNINVETGGQAKMPVVQVRRNINEETGMQTKKPVVKEKQMVQEMPVVKEKPVVTAKTPVVQTVPVRSVVAQNVTMKKYGIVVSDMPVGEAKKLYDRIISGMKWTSEDVQLMTAKQALERPPVVKVLIVLGFKTAKALNIQGATLGMATSWQNIPTVITYSLEKINTLAGDENLLHDAKLQMFKDLKLAISIVIRN